MFILGDGVPHVHVHVIGRYPGAPREYRGPGVDEWPDCPHPTHTTTRSLTLVRVGPVFNRSPRASKKV